MSEYSLLSQCAIRIKRWPRLNAKSFPDLPSKCEFVEPRVGGYVLVIAGRVFCKDAVNKEKKRLAKERK